MSGMAQAQPARGTTQRPAVGWLSTLLTALALAACSHSPQTPHATQTPPSPPGRPGSTASTPVRNDIALYALSLLDTRYSWGGRGPATGFDCSGLVSHVYREAAGMKLGGSSVALGQMSRPIDPDQKQPGDLVFFNTLGSRHSHVGVYIGNGRFVHASNPRTGVRIDQLSNSYYAQRFEGVHTLLD